MGVLKPEARRESVSLRNNAAFECFPGTAIDWGHPLGSVASKQRPRWSSEHQSCSPNQLSFLKMEVYGPGTLRKV